MTETLQPLDTVAEATSRFRDAAAEIEAAYGARKPATTDQVTPAQLIEAVQQFLSVIANLDHEEGATGPILRDDVDHLGEYGLTVLNDLISWADQLGLRQSHVELEQVMLTGADWVIRHEGEIRAVEPVVNALANLANRVSDPRVLGQMVEFMGQVIEACPNIVKQDLERSNPGRPWRLLHLNRAIVATRSHNPALMEQAFDDLIRHLPDEAPTFFEEGMQQMELLNYPPHVREVMSRYHDACDRPTLH